MMTATRDFVLLLSVLLFGVSMAFKPFPVRATLDTRVAVLEHDGESMKDGLKNIATSITSMENRLKTELKADIAATENRLTSNLMETKTDLKEVKANVTILKTELAKINFWGPIVLAMVSVLAAHVGLPIIGTILASIRGITP